MLLVKSMNIMLGIKLNIFGLALFFVNKKTDCTAIKKIIMSFNTFIINKFLFDITVKR